MKRTNRNSHRIYIDGVNGAVGAERLSYAPGGGATMEHSLPFLALGKTVTDDTGTQWQIRSVQLAFRDDGVPRLVIGLDAAPATAATEPPRVSGVRADRGTTMSYEQRLDVAAARAVVVADVEPAFTPQQRQLASASTMQLYRSAPPAVHDSDQIPTFLVARREGFFAQFWRELRHAALEIGEAIERLVEGDRRRAR